MKCVRIVFRIIVSTNELESQYDTTTRPELIFPKKFFFFFFFFQSCSDKLIAIHTRERYDG